MQLEFCKKMPIFLLNDLFYAAVQSSYQEVDLFKELRGGPNFDSVFGQSSSPQNSFPAPASTAPPPSANSSGGLLPAAMGDMLTPQAVGIQAEIAAQEKKMDQQPLGLTTDVESSLARAAANLSEFTVTHWDEVHTPSLAPPTELDMSDQ